MVKIIDFNKYKETKRKLNMKLNKEFMEYEAPLPHCEDRLYDFTDESEIQSFLSDLDDYTIPF